MFALIRGGKDSDVTLYLFKASGIPFEVHNSHVTVDAPPTVYHIRDTFKKLENDGIKAEIDYHVQPDGTRTTMWKLIIKKMMPPTRIARYCCAEMKETGCANRMIATGVRWDESTQRKRNREAFETIGKTASDKTKVSDEKMLLTDQSPEYRKLVESCQMKAKTIVNPIIDWKDKDIWEYIEAENIKTNTLYQCGYNRVGCIGCPMARYKERMKEFNDFPKYKQAYLHAFDKMLANINSKGKLTRWKTADEVFSWWIEDPNIKGQLSFEDVWNKDLLV